MSQSSWHPLCLWIFYEKNNNNTVMESQYPCSWWPGNTRNQGINSNGITILNTSRAIRQNSPNIMMFQNSIPPICETTMQQGMSPWWALMGLISWCPIITSISYNPFEDQVPVGFIYKWLIFKWIEKRLHDWYCERCIYASLGLDDFRF